MARPKRENADYFSHDAGMRDDPKVKALRNKFGITGYAVWCMMLEILTNSDFFKREIDDLEIEILSADFGIESDLFSEILSYMVRLKLLQTVNNCEYLSQKLTERLQPVTDKRNNARNRRITVTESTQSKVKETKVKETKVKETKVNKEKITFDLPDFVDRALFDGFLKMRNKLKVDNTDLAIQRLIKILKENESDANEIIDLSLTNQWKGLFPLKKSFNKTIDSNKTRNITIPDVGPAF